MLHSSPRKFDHKSVDSTTPFYCASRRYFVIHYFPRAALALAGSPSTQQTAPGPVSPSSFSGKPAPGNQRNIVRPVVVKRRCASRFSSQSKSRALAHFHFHLVSRPSGLSSALVFGPKTRRDVLPRYKCTGVAKSFARERPRSIPGRSAEEGRREPNDLAVLHRLPVIPSRGRSVCREMSPVPLADRRIRARRSCSSARLFFIPPRLPLLFYARQKIFFFSKINGATSRR